VAQLFSLGSKASPEIFRSDFAAEFFGGSVFGSEATGEPVSRRKFAGEFLV